jgi:hypothetical protein
MTWKSSLLLALACVATTSALPSHPQDHPHQGNSCPVKRPDGHEKPLEEIIRLIEGCPEGHLFCRELIREKCEVVTKTKTMTPVPKTVKVTETITDHPHRVTKAATNWITSTIVKPQTGTTTLHTTSTLTRNVGLTVTDLSTLTTTDISTVFQTESDYETVTVPVTTFITNTITEATTDYAAATITQSFTDTTTETFTNTITDYSTAYITAFITDLATDYVTNLYTDVATATVTNLHTETVTLSFTDTATATTTDTILSTTTQAVGFTETNTLSETTIQTDFETITNTVPVTATEYTTAIFTTVQTDGVTVTTTAVVTVAPAKRDMIDGHAAFITPSALRGIHDTYLSSACSTLYAEHRTSTVYTTKTVATPTVRLYASTWEGIILIQ